MYLLIGLAIFLTIFLLAIQWVMDEDRRNKND